MPWALLLGFVFLSIAQASHADVTRKRKFLEVMSEVMGAPEYQATQSTIRSVELDFATRDLLLQPQLELEARRLNERRMFLNSFGPLKARTDSLTATVTKPFSTGTTLKVTPALERALMPSLDPSQRSTFDWQVSITQKLWQDSFGRATSLRWSREGFERRQQVASALTAQAQVLVEFENLYWDWAMALRERELREKNVQRGQEILRWIQGRFARSAAETSDVLQAEALLGNRQLQLVSVEQSLRLVASRMERFAPGVKWEPDPDELALERDPDKLLVPWRLDEINEPQRLELISVRNGARAAEERVEEGLQQILPALDLTLAYGKNAIDPDRGKAVNRAISEHHEMTSIGLVFKTGLDFGLAHKRLESARVSSQAAKLRMNALEAEAKVAWTQVKRTLSDLRERTLQARKLAAVQSRKSDAERRRYRLGRSTAFQAITFEQEAAEAEINLWNLYAVMRKSEAQARMFAR